MKDSLNKGEVPTSEKIYVLEKNALIYEYLNYQLLHLLHVAIDSNKSLGDRLYECLNSNLKNALDKNIDPEEIFSKINFNSIRLLEELGYQHNFNGTYTHNGIVHKMPNYEFIFPEKKSVFEEKVLGGIKNVGAKIASVFSSDTKKSAKPVLQKS